MKIHMTRHHRYGVTWSGKPLNNATYLFLSCKWYAKSSINALVQEKNSAKIKPLPIIYMHEYVNINISVYIYTCFNQNNATCLEKFTLQTQIHFIYKQTYINLSISLHQQFWVLVRIRSSKISPTNRAPTPYGTFGAGWSGGSLFLVEVSPFLVVAT